MKVLVLMGGKTPEHEISLISGKEVVKNLDKDKYEVSALIIPRKGKGWFPKNFPQIDVVFIAMHGPYGEDGTIQGMLGIMGIPYTGSGVLASAVGMDKLVFRKLMENAKIPIPKYVVFRKGDPLTKISEGLGRPPYFIKPHNQGSAIGASIVKNRRDISKSLRIAFRYSNTVLVDKYIKGVEVTCGILGNSSPKVLPLVEIIPKNEFFDYEAKYGPETQEICPARISKVLTRKVQEMALKVYRIVGCKGFARVDFILEDGTVSVVLEINTIPGLTPVSLLPKEAKAAGLGYPQLLDKIIQYAVE